MINIFKFIYDYLFEILLILSIIFLIIYTFTRLHKQGSYSLIYEFDDDKKYDHYKLNNNVTRANRDVFKSLKKNNLSKGELKCKFVLEKIFDKPFNKIRPDFLNNSVINNNNLELDCYNHSLKLAVEYNGEQHYKYIPYFHKNKEAFYNQKYRDELKRIKCKENNITLIEVPYYVNNIEKYLINELIKLNYLEIK